MFFRRSSLLNNKNTGVRLQRLTKFRSCNRNGCQTEQAVLTPIKRTSLWLRHINLQKLVQALKIDSTIVNESERVQKWLQLKQLTQEDVFNILHIMQGQTADEMLPYLNERVPMFALAEFIKSPTYSRKTFYQMVQVFRSSIPRFSSSSADRCLLSLVQRAIDLDPDLLRLLMTDLLDRTLITTNPRTLYTLSAMLTPSPEIEQRVHPQILYMHKKVMEARERRRLPGWPTISRMRQSGGRRRSSQIKRPINHRAGSRNSFRRSEGGRLAHLFHAKLPIRQQTFDLMQSSNSDVSNHRVWKKRLMQNEQSGTAIHLCLEYIKTGQVRMTTTLMTTLLRSCTTAERKESLNEIVRLAVVQDVKFDTLTWITYLERLIWAGRYKEAVSILVNEPGGNDYLDMPPVIRRNTLVWSTLVLHLNRLVRYNKCSANKHARLLGKIISAFHLFDLAPTHFFLRCLLQAAFFSGSRPWNRKHPCDILVTCFGAWVDLGSEAWKIQAKQSLWENYMLILVANEEVSLLDKAMQDMLNSGQVPSQRLLKTFALGIWESGSIDAIQRWQEYFETEFQGVYWPTSQETFAHRKVLSGPDGLLQYFYK